MGKVMDKEDGRCVYKTKKDGPYRGRFLWSTGRSYFPSEASEKNFERSHRKSQTFNSG
jgi:hypothetical protein